MGTLADPSERDSIPLSALNHLLFCDRRCALIHVEGVFVENRYTVEGRFAHERADEPDIESRPGVRIVRGLPLYSHRLGLSGKADVVEFHAVTGGAERPQPVDYKRGRRRRWDNDDIQLCAQALCLEEMTGLDVPEGSIFHVRSRHRRAVAFDQALRNDTEEAIRRLHALIETGSIPEPVLRPRCEGCSLRAVCVPELPARGPALAAASAALFAIEEETEP